MCQGEEKANGVVGFPIVKVQEDLGGRRKREEEVEEEGEDPYNEENLEQVGSAA